MYLTLVSFKIEYREQLCSQTNYWLELRKEIFEVKGELQVILNKIISASWEFHTQNRLSENCDLK